MTVKWVGPLLAGVAALLSVGCGTAAERVAEEATERAVEEQTGGSAEVDVDDGSVRVDGEGGSLDIGTGQVPEEWPEDVPILDGVEVLSGTTTNDPASGTFVTVGGSTDLAPYEVVDAYRDALTDWEVEADGSQSSSGGSLSTVVFVNGERRLQVGAVAGDDGITAVSLSHATA